MAGSIATGSLADSELVLDDPREITWLDAERPLAAKFLRHRLTMLQHVSDDDSEPLMASSYIPARADIACGGLAARDS